MAFGPHPTFTASYPLPGLTQPQLTVLAMEAASRLGWRLHYLSGSGLIASTPERPAQISVRLADAQIELSSASLIQELWDRGRNRANTTRFMDVLQALQAQVPAEQLDARYEEILPMLPPPEADALLRRPPRQSSAAADILAIFRPVKGYFITPILLNLNLTVFLLMVLTGASLTEPASGHLLAWGANYRPYTLGGEWWRLLTCCFVHIGAFHLAMNMYAFLLIGAQLEPRLGRARFLAAYLLSGIAASAVSLWWHEGASISAGASGAIFGMYGVFLVMLRAGLVEKGKRKQLLFSVIFFLTYSLLGGLQEGIDNAAHIGGLVAGMIISAAFLPGLKKAQAPEHA